MSGSLSPEMCTVLWRAFRVVLSWGITVAGVVEHGGGLIALADFVIAAMPLRSDAASRLLGMVLPRWFRPDSQVNTFAGRRLHMVTKQAIAGVAPPEVAEVTMMTDLSHEWRRSCRWDVNSAQMFGIKLGVPPVDARPPVGTGDHTGLARIVLSSLLASGQSVGGTC